MSSLEPTTETVERLGMSEAAREPLQEESRELSPFLPLMLLVIGLAIATVWFVVLPTFDKSAPGRTCEVVVLPNEAPRCIEPPGMRAEGPRSKRSSR